MIFPRVDSFLSLKELCHDFYLIIKTPAKTNWKKDNLEIMTQF